MQDDIYYMIELQKILDLTPELVLVKEKDVGDILKNLDKVVYRLVSVYGVGKVTLDYSKFLQQTKGLERGGNV